MCVAAISGRMFNLGCLGPALVIIVVLACLKRRKKFKLEYFDGRPGLLVPINFLRSFSYSNRFTIAATFGATASTCLRLFLFAESGMLFPLGGPGWVKVFHGLIAVLVYGILFYPFFACLTTEYKLLGSFLGFLYAAIRFSFTLGIYFQCWGSYKGDVKKSHSIATLGLVPTGACLLFVTVRFAVLLFLQVRQKWFPTTNGANEVIGKIERTFKTCDTSLIREPGILYVQQLFNQIPRPRPGMEDERWYMRLVHYIYRSRPDFKFSTQLISTLVVAGIVIFEFSLWLLGFLDVASIDSFLAALVLSALLIAMMMLHFMKCHRDHVLQLYRGQRKISQDVSASPANFVGKSLLFSGYQIAYVFIDGSFPSCLTFFSSSTLLLDFFSCSLRIVFGAILGVLFLSRIDRTTLMHGFQILDRGFMAYLGFINVLVAHSHPVMLMFCQLLINRDKDRGLVNEQSLPKPQNPTQAEQSRQTGIEIVRTREPRQPRLSQKAFNRWHVAVTLLRNPSLIKHRKQGGVPRTVSVSLTSIRADVTALV